MFALKLSLFLGSATLVEMAAIAGEPFMAGGLAIAAIIASIMVLEEEI